MMGVHNLNTTTKRRTKLGLALEQSAKEILAHVKGDASLPTRRIALPDEGRCEAHPDQGENVANAADHTSRS
jgi:hypothetical protein